MKDIHANRRDMLRATAGFAGASWACCWPRKTKKNTRTTSAASPRQNQVIGFYDPDTGGGILSGLFALAALIPAILVDIKRWHDRDKSGWWMLIALVPIIGTIWFLIELGFLAGTPGSNRFGPPPMDA
jgi:uncharacterized membrane protein YhaH (DUF805 family)